MDARNLGAEKSSWPEYYFVRKSTPDVTWANQEPPLGWRGAVVVVRTAVDPKLAAFALRGLFASLDPTLPVEISTMRERLAQGTGRPRFQAAPLAAFAVVGVLLAAIGLSGVMSFLVAQRRREIGVWMALGVTPGSMVRLTLGFAARSTAAGLVIGGAGAYVATRWLRAQLCQVAAGDPRPLALAAGLLVFVALIAAAGPARRAARVDPGTTLRAGVGTQSRLSRQSPVSGRHSGSWWERSSPGIGKSFATREDLLLAMGASGQPPSG